ncbi:MAG: polysulfide reductase NrfD [Thermodesulfobacteriota bacterium]|nr:polysulfide reductase NrfD [Thermodesulfobacteriota bacterium]
MILRAQSKWSWSIAAYLFLAGMGAGAYVTGVVADLAGWERPSIPAIGVCLGFPSVLIGCMFLVLDLGSPANFWRAWRKPQTSWIARGTIIISIFMILGAIHLGLWVWPFHILDQAADCRYLLSILGALFAFGTMIYTGILLGALRPIAFWSTAMLPLLFLVSALSTGVMAVILIGTLAGVAEEAIRVLEKADILLIALEMFVLLFYFQATHRVPESRASARLVLAGTVAPSFWIGVVCLGLLIPLGLELASVTAAEGSGATTVLGTLCGLAGGLLLREVILRGGVLAPLKAGRFEYALTNP